VAQSLTKFLGGHGNSIGGVIVDGGAFNWSREKGYPMLCEPRPEYHNACSPCDIVPALSPFNAFLILTGIEIRPLCMRRHCDNALAVA
jgi:O-acetylhomoserine (thiol)-lyase